MIKCNGTLRIKKIRQSRNGAFCVADLSTDFGEFKVKDPLLDQFDEGEYLGTVWINEIYLSQYISYGKAVTELRARLHDLQVDSEDRKPVRSTENSEPDPLDEVPTPQVPKKAAGVPAKRAADWASFKGNKLSKTVGSGQPADVRETANTAQNDAPPVEVESHIELFGLEIVGLMDQHQVIKLDPTVDRMLLRKQAATLRAKGYAFDSKQQAWFFRAS